MLQAVRRGECKMTRSTLRAFISLCTCCRSNAGCPKFPQGDYQPQWQPALTRLADLKQNRSALDAEIREMEAALKLAHSLSGTLDWINAGQHRFRLTTTAGRRSLSREALHEELVRHLPF